MPPKKEEDNESSSQNGGLSGGIQKIRQGQIDWVSAVPKAASFKSWLFRFKTGAKMYLSKKVYPEEEERRYAWLNALLRAATLGENEEMISLLELYDSSGVTCEELIEKLEKKFLPEEETERKKVTLSFMAYSRGNKSLTVAVKELKILLLDCERYGFKPDDATRKAKYESLLLSSELPFFTLYLNADLGNKTESLQGEKESEKVIRVLEKYGRDQDGIKSIESGNSHSFAGSSFSPQRRQERDKQPRRKGFKPGNSDGKGQANSTQKTECKKCGNVCPAMKGTGACPAKEKACNKCGKIGHFEKVCFSSAKKKDNNAKAGAAFSTIETQAKERGDSF